MEIKKLEGNLEEADTAHFPTSSKEKIQQAIAAVNPSQVSQVVDANGAPLVVKHGADADTEKLQSNEGETVAVSTGERRTRQINEKIKTASIPLYIKGGASPTHGTGGTPEGKPPLPGKTSPEGDTIVSHGNGEKSSGNEEKMKSR